MPIYMPFDTRGVLSATAEKCDSRSLLLDRFCDPTAKEEARKQVFSRAMLKRAISIKASDWPSFLTNNMGMTLEDCLFGQLRSRLMVNMAGGVMENAGLCLDRFGMPYVPGSAVKGCARRMATHQLLETKGADAKADLLFRIALIFGWGDTEWKAGRKRKRHNGREIETEPYSDFWWAMAEDAGDHSADAARHQLWQEVAVSVATRLLDRLNVRTRQHREEPWKDLPNFAGIVCFLPAYPVDAAGAQLPLAPPPLGALELDVVTCHHPEYYRGDCSVATDDEDPNPVVFPAVAPGHVFAFALAPLRGADNDLLKQARTWLAQGLETFGLGAKTNAGYGWFDCSDEIQTAVSDQLKKKAAAEEKRRREEEERQKAKAAEEERLRKKRELEAKLKDLTPEQQEDYKLDQMSEDQLKNHLLNYSKLSELQQAAVYRLLKDRRPDLWRNLRQLSETGKQKERKRWSPLVQDMFKRAKQNNERMPK